MTAVGANMGNGFPEAPLASFPRKKPTLTQSAGPDLDFSVVAGFEPDLEPR